MGVEITSYYDGIVILCFDAFFKVFIEFSDDALITGVVDVYN